MNALALFDVASEIVEVNDLVTSYYPFIMASKECYLLSKKPLDCFFNNRIKEDWLSYESTYYNEFRDIEVDLIFEILLRCPSAMKKTYWERLLSS